MAAVSCGGKTVGDGSPGAAGDQAIAFDRPAPTCTVICQSTGLALLGITERRVRKRLRVYEEHVRQMPKRARLVSQVHGNHARTVHPR